MAEPPNGDHNSGNHYFNYETQGFSSTMPMDNLFDFTEDVDMSELFDLLEYQPPTNYTPSSLIENVVPNHQNTIEIGASSDNQNTLEVQDDYSLSYIFSMGTKNVASLQEEGGEIINNGDGIEQENPKTNDLTTNQPMPKTPILEEHENPRTNDLITNQPMPKTPILEEQGSPRTNDLIPNQSTPKVPIFEEQENPSTNAMILQQPMPRTPILEEQENPKTSDLILNQPTPKVPILEKQASPKTTDLITNQLMRKEPILEEQENPKTTDLITNQPMPKIPTLEEEENPRTNAMILQQAMPKIPSVEELESDFIASRMEQENPRNNDMVLQQHMPTIPYLLTEKERDFITRRREQEKSGRDSMKPKLTTDHPYGISTSTTRKEQENPKTNDLLLQQPMPIIPCLLKAKERNFMNSKYTIGTSTRKEQETSKTNDMILNPPTTTIPSSEKKESDFLRPKMTNIHPFRPRHPTLEKKKSEHMKSKLINTNSPYGISTTKEGKFNLLGIGTGKTTWNAYFGSRTTHKDDESRYGVLNSFDNQLQVELPQKTSSSSGGPIRRSPNQTSSRYQPFGRQISNNQGSNRFSQSSSESTFNRSQAADGSVVCDIGKLWKNQRKEIKRKIGIASSYSGSSNIHTQIWNNLQKRSLSPQVAEIEKRNSNGEDLIGGTSSKKDNHSMLQNLPNQNFQHSPANTQDIITNQINSGIAGGQSMTNQGTSYYSTKSSQSWGYAPGISLGNGYGAQLQQGGYYAMETGNEIMDAQSSGFQAMENEITVVQSSGFQAMGNEITDVQYSGVQATGNGTMIMQSSGVQITDVPYSGVQATGNGIMNVQSSGFQAMGNDITDVQYSKVQATRNGMMDMQSSGFQAMRNDITDVQYSGVQAAGNDITDVQYSGFQAAKNGITEIQYSGFQATGNEITNVQYSGVQAMENEIMDVQYSGYAQGVSGSKRFTQEQTHFNVTNWQFGDESQGNL